jgi:type IV secretion system protein VirB10
MGNIDHEPQPVPKVAPEGVALRAPPRSVTRLNRRMLAIAATVLTVAVAGASMWALQSKGRRGSVDQTELYNVNRVAKADDLDQLPADYSKLPTKPAPVSAASVPQLGPPLPGDWGAASVAPLPAGSGNTGPSAESIDRQREAEEVARSSVFFRTSNITGKTGAATTIPQVPAMPNASAGPFNPMGAGPASTAAQPNDPTAIQSRQDQKEAFLTKGGDAVTSNTGTLQIPSSPYTVMAGTVIPAALVTGINSDLPGQIIAEVTQPVYDTGTGRYLLIPQGSRLIGRYDSQVAFGQRRVLLVWLRLVVPDTSSITLDKLPGIAPAAKQQGKFVAATIRARLKSEPAPGDFRYVHSGSLATIGKRAAVVDFGWLKLTGWTAWWLWGLAHIYFLIGVRNRLAVALSWLWIYLRGQRSARLITQGDAQGDVDAQSEAMAKK